MLQLSEKSGSRDSAFTFRVKNDYIFNDEDEEDFFNLNEGF